jgi:hypothetical protein
VCANRCALLGSNGTHDLIEQVTLIVNARGRAWTESALQSDPRPVAQFADTLQNEYRTTDFDLFYRIFGYNMETIRLLETQRIGIIRGRTVYKTHCRTIYQTRHPRYRNNDDMCSHGTLMYAGSSQSLYCPRICCRHRRQCCVHSRFAPLRKLDRSSFWVTT